MNSAASSRLKVIQGVRPIESPLHHDDRGFFREVIRDQQLGTTILQVNYSVSTKGVIRGLHIQRERPQGKVVSIAAGIVMDVFLDCRRDSPSFGMWDAVMLRPGLSLYLPPGIAHGFECLSDYCTMIYACTHELFDPKLDAGIRYDDPDLKIQWDSQNPIVSAKDKALPMWSEYTKDLG